MIGVTILVVVWFILSVFYQWWYALMSVCAFLFELVLPVVGCILLLAWLTGDRDLDGSEVGMTLLVGFIIALFFLYLVSMIVPTAIMNVHGHFMDGSALTFWGKKIAAYFDYTFSDPLRHQMAAA